MPLELKSSTLRLVVELVRDVRGATAIEYALIATFVFLVIFGSVQAVGQTVLMDMFERTANAFSSAANP